MAINLSTGARAQRKLLVTIAEWTVGSGQSAVTHKEILGTRTEDSSIDFNADIETTTDIRGITYTDVNKTEPQQTFDPFFILGGSAMSEYLTQAALKNDINAYNNVFNIYVVTMFIGDATDGYYTVKHANSSIIPTSIGGDSYVAMPIEVHYSNDITEGTGKFTGDDGFTFTPA